MREGASKAKATEGATEGEGHRRRKPPMGFEPTTCALRKRCSTAELGWQGAESIHEIQIEVEEKAVWNRNRVLGERFRASES